MCAVCREVWQRRAQQVASIEVGGVCIPVGFVLLEKLLSWLKTLNSSYICHAWEVVVCSRGVNEQSVDVRPCLRPGMPRAREYWSRERLGIRRQLLANSGGEGSKIYSSLISLPSPFPWGGLSQLLRGSYQEAGGLEISSPLYRDVTWGRGTNLAL